MIENATVIINGREIKTRLHEHGKQPAYEFQPRDEWLESGYFDGTPEDMQAIKDASPPELAIYQNGVLVSSLSGIQWGNAEEIYEGKSILHLDWKE